MTGKDKARIVVLVGPTGVGKSDLGILVSELLGGEVVSADSMQVYRLMDIGTGKVRPDEMAGIPHHLIGIVEPAEEFTVAEYVRRADKAIAEIGRRGNVPVVVGGTGLYVKALMEHFLFPDQGADWGFRARMRAMAEEDGNEALHQRLEQVDAVAAARLHPNDLKRVIRALEVFENTGVSITEQMANHGPGEPRYDALTIGLTCSRTELYERIDRRVDKMMAQGLVDEVRVLAAAGYGGSATSMQALGYKEIIGYLEAEYDLPTAIEILKRDTRRYAKRQLSWFTKNKDTLWYDRGDWPDIRDLALHISGLYAGSPS